ncbi:hypothetical protein D3C81_1882370 [compost metagenome]
MAADTVEVAMKYGYVEKSGSWFALMEEPGTGEVVTNHEGDFIKIQGMANFLAYLKEEGSDFFDDLYQKINDLVSAA